MNLDGQQLGWLLEGCVGWRCWGCVEFGLYSGQVGAKMLEETSFHDWLQALETIDFFGTFVEASFEFVDNRWIGRLGHGGLLAL